MKRNIETMYLDSAAKYELFLSVESNESPTSKRLKLKDYSQSTAKTDMIPSYTNNSVQSVSGSGSGSNISSTRENASATVFQTPAAVSRIRKRVSSASVNPSIAHWETSNQKWSTAMQCVFQHLSTVEVLRCAAVCKSWQEAGRSEKVWRSVDLHNAWKRVNDMTLVAILERHGSIIESLRLDQCFGVTDEGMRKIAHGCPKLTCISLKGCWAITDSSVKELAMNVPELRVINLSSCRKLTDLAVVSLTNHCINLVSLDLEYCKNLTDVTLKYILARCRLLCTLNLKRCTGLSNDAFAVFSEFPAYSLRHLNLSDCYSLSDAAISHVANGSRELRSLNLSFCSGLTGVALEHVAQQCTRLERIDISSCCALVKDEAIARMLGFDTSSLDRHMGEQNTTIPDVVDSTAPFRTSLRHVSMRACPKVSDLSMRLFNNGCLGLESIDVMNCNGISPETIGQCGNVKKIIAGCTMGLTPTKRPRLQASHY